MIDSERTARDAWDQGCWTPRSKKIRGVYGYVLETELSLSSRGRMTLGGGKIFWFISHSSTMSCPPRGWGYIFIGC
jgi:hypothetical protein